MMDRGNDTQCPKITVVVDPEIKDIIPIFLENRHGDVGTVLDALDRSDYETIRILGHSLQGTGGVVNQQQWDRSGPEKITAMESRC